MLCPEIGTQNNLQVTIAKFIILVMFVVPLAYFFAMLLSGKMSRRSGGKMIETAKGVLCSTMKFETFTSVLVTCKINTKLKVWHQKGSYRPLVTLSASGSNESEDCVLAALANLRCDFVAA